MASIYSSHVLAITVCLYVSQLRLGTNASLAMDKVMLLQCPRLVLN